MQSAPPYYSYTAYALKIGDFVLAAGPGEPFTQIGVRVYEATGLPGEPPSASAAPYEAALALARAGRWKEAAQAFSALGDEPAARHHADRCATLAAEHAPADVWDAIWNLTQK